MSSPTSIGRSISGNQVEDVSSVRVDPKALQTSRELKAAQRLPRVSGRGACAPRYSTGQVGACIHNKPCRGFGVKNEAGQVYCTCYGQVGGCSERQRCDDRKLVCVPEDEPLQERLQVN